MHFCNCNGKKMSENFDIEHKNVEGGVQFTVIAKDKSKAEAFQKFVEACDDFYGKDCC